MKLKFNKSYSIIILVLFLILASVGMYFVISKKSAIPNFKSDSFKGVIKTGEQLGELKNYCSEGLYLVLDDNSKPTDDINLLQLRVPDEDSNTKMYNDTTFIGQQVEVIGKYPAQEMFCQALMCDCEDYILIESEKSVTPYQSQ